MTDGTDGEAGSLRIAVDTLAVGDAQWGSRRVLQSLLPALARRADRDERLVVIVSNTNRHLFEALRALPNVELHEVRLRSRSPIERVVADQWAVPRLAARVADVLFMPADVGALRCRVPQVVNVWSHLSIPVVRRENPRAVDSAQTSRLRDGYHRMLMGPSLRRVAKVTAISGYLATQVTRQWRVPAEGVPLGVDPPAPADEGTDDGDAGTTGPGDRYVLFVGSLYPYKNARQVISAHALVDSSRAPALRLVVVGADPDGTQAGALARLAAGLGTIDRVELRGAVDDDELERLYRGAACVVLTSYGEGFGLPVAEAMAHRVPVVVSDRMSLPEVVGDAGLVVDPDDDHALAASLTRVLDDTDLAERLRAAAAQRAGALTWDATADRYLEIFRSAAAQA